MPKDNRWKSTQQHFVFNNGTEPETLDPHLMTGSPELRLARGLFEGLTTLDPSSLTPRPGVAESWELSEQGTLYTFQLRKNARWSDGSPLTANDFLKSWKRALSPDTGGAYVNLLFCIEGAEAYFKGTETDFETVGIRTDGPHVLQVSLVSPCSYFLELTAFSAFFPVRVDLIQKHESRWMQPEHLVVNGPFILSDWAPRQHVELKKNENYWDARFVKLNKVTALPLDDLNTAYQLFIKKKVHWLAAIPQARIEEIRRHPDYYVTPFFGTYFYRFNTTGEPFTDSRVRRALCLATDREEITRHILKSGQLPVSSLCPPISGYKPIEGLKYNRTAARNMLREAGYGEGMKRFPPIEILYNTSEAHKTIAEAIAQQWKRNLGITVSARNVEWKIFLNDMKDLQYEVCRSSWIGDYGDPGTFFDIFTGDDGNNRTGWVNEEYDSLSELASGEPLHSRRLEYFTRMEHILVEEDCPIMPIYRYVNQGMLAESVCGWYENIRDIHNLKYIWLEGE